MPALRRSSSNPQSKRDISGSLLGSSSESNNRRRRLWMIRIVSVGLVVFAVVYLIAYLQALYAAIHRANHKLRTTTKEDQRTVLLQNKQQRQQQAVKPNEAAAAAQDNARMAAADAAAITTQKKETLVLTTQVGVIKIVLRPDLSPESVEYVKAIVQYQACDVCNLYRAQKPGILQGIMKTNNNKDIPAVTQKGKCPPGSETVANNCPKWDKQCTCHGPVMTRGMVGWAAGQTGPDFFMDDYKRPADWWGTQHTVWGEIQDETSFQVLDHIWTLPAHNQGGMTMLNEKLHFDLAIEG